jgi:tyrosyl-tRNA synthetase
MLNIDKNCINHILGNGVTEIIIEKELRERMHSGKPLRLKMGFDPSAPDIHLGHTVGLKKLKEFQDIGHQVVLIVGDWTARIGDPSGKSKTRPVLTESQVNANALTYLDQFFKIIDKDKTEVRWQSEWFKNFNLADLISLTSKFTVAQFLAREDFAKRFNENQPIAITEFIYPLMQAYDSVIVKSDIEFGGTDQKFNLLVGRDLQQYMGQTPQQCLLMPLLPGTDGTQKMSKSLNNHIGISEDPNDIFGKTMSIPDSLISTYYSHLTQINAEDLDSINNSLDKNTTHPMELKKQLAHNLVTQFYDLKSADSAQKYFELTVQSKETPENIDIYTINPDIDRKITDILVNSKLTNSVSESRRLINQNAVKLNGVNLSLSSNPKDLQTDDIISIGKRRWIKIDNKQKNQ